MVKLGGHEAVEAHRHRADRRGGPRRARRRASASTTRSSPASTHELEDGDKLVFTDVRIVKKHVDGEVIDFGTVEQRGRLDVRGRDLRRPRRRDRPARRDLPDRLPQRRDHRPQGPRRQNVLRASRSTRSSRSAPRSRPRRTSPAAAPSGTSSRSASPAATGPSTPATATTAACSSTSAPGRRTAAPACRATPAARPRSPSPPSSATPPAATAPGRAAPPRSACRADARAALTTLAHMSDTSAGPEACSGRRRCVRSRPRSTCGPTKQRGQNFVIDANTVRRIVRESGITADDVVLEVGPGLGSLTLALLEVAGRVVAIEVDDKLADPAAGDDRDVRARARSDRFEVVLADALRDRRGARPGADRAGRQPALQRLGAGAAAPAGAAALAASTGW